MRENNSTVGKITNHTTRAELEKLNFGPWDGSGLLLIPKKLWGRIANGTKLECIDGKKRVKMRGVVFDKDTRYGYLAWGLRPTA